MFTPKRVFVVVVVTSAVYVGFAATVPNPKPNTPLTTRQKIAKYVKPRVVDKALDKLRDKVVDFAMYEGAKRIGGPFRGSDENTTRELLGLVIDPRQWGQAPIKVVTKGLNPSQTASKVDDTPGADPATQSSRLPFQSHAAPEPNVAAPKSDLSSHPSQAPDRDFVAAHSTPSSGHPSIGISTSWKGDSPAPNSPSHDIPVTSQPSEAPISHGNVETLAAGQQPMVQAQQLDFIRGSDGHFYAVPHVSQPAPVPASAPVPAPPSAAAPPPPAPPSHYDRGGPNGHSDPMGGAHEINHGADKPDHNTPGGRDVSHIS